MTKTITRAEAESNYFKARDAYGQRHRLSTSQATAEFATTSEAQALYKCITVAAPNPPVAKQAEVTAPYSDDHAFAKTIGTTIEEIAKQSFPDLAPVAALDRYLQTKEGKEAYIAYRRALSAASVG